MGNFMNFSIFSEISILSPMVNAKGRHSPLSWPGVRTIKTQTSTTFSLQSVPLEWNSFASKTKRGVASTYYLWQNFVWIAERLLASNGRLGLVEIFLS